MKRRIKCSLIWAVGVLFLGSLSVIGKDAASPDDRFSVKCDSQISLVDKQGKEILNLVRNTSMDNKIDVLWSPDSSKVVVVENSARGCDVIAAYRQGSVWHKAIEKDEDQIPIIQRLQSQFKSRIVAENASVGQWHGGSITIYGEITLSNKLVKYGYVLRFNPNAKVVIDRGGYEEGSIVGTDYRISL